MKLRKLEMNLFKKCPGANCSVLTHLHLEVGAKLNNEI